MLVRSQPLALEISKKFASENKRDFEAMSEQNIKSQRIGELFDDIFNDSGKHKISLKTRLGWKWRLVQDTFYNFKLTVRNHIKWHKTMCKLHPWEGFNGLFDVMLTHLSDYAENEEKYGHSAEEWKKQKIASVKETMELLERMKKPDEYQSRCRNEVESRYPEYKSLITEYENGDTSCSGNFVAQGGGWVEIESGGDPRKGYFEFANGRFELADSPDQCKTDRLLEELRKYEEEINDAYIQAEIDSDKDFEKLNQLLKENLYSWWD